MKRPSRRRLRPSDRLFAAETSLRGAARTFYVHDSDPASRIALRRAAVAYAKIEAEIDDAGRVP